MNKLFGGADKEDKLTFIYKNNFMHIDDDTKTLAIRDEHIFFGPLGLKMKYYNKEDNQTLKISVSSNDGKTFSYKKFVNGKLEEEETLDKKDVIKKLTTNKIKDPKIFTDYLKNH
jgi:hypothetical protein